MTNIARSMGGSALVLGLYGVIAAVLTVGIYISTKDTIVEQQRMAKARALTQIVEEGQYNNQLLDDQLVLHQVNLLGPVDEALAYIARQGREAVVVILPVTVIDGYGGDMNMIVGVRADGSISGVRVLKHNETPGLGDKIDIRKSDWIEAFSGRSLANPNIERWTVKKDGGVFDQFTGATITPRAVVKGVARALSYFEANRQYLLAALPEPKETPPVEQRIKETVHGQ